MRMPSGSRIDGEQMKAVDLAFYKRKLTDISKELFLENGWPLPEGLRDYRRRDPLKFTLEEWQQAKRTGLDPKETKSLLRECWNVSDTRASFEAALREKGFWLAHGDQRSFVAVDWRGEVYSLSRSVGAKKKELTARLGKPGDLRSVDETKAHIGAQLTPKILSWAKDAEDKARRARLTVNFQSEEMVQRHRQVRTALSEKQQERWQAEARVRASRTPRGISGLWGWITGKNKKIRQINEAEIRQARARDTAERQEIILKQIEERRNLQAVIAKVRQRQADLLFALSADVAKAMLMGRVPENATKQKERSGRTRDRRKSRDQGPDFEPS